MTPSEKEKNEESEVEMREVGSDVKERTIPIAARASLPSIHDSSADDSSKKRNWITPNPAHIPIPSSTQLSKEESTIIVSPISTDPTFSSDEFSSDPSDWSVPEFGVLPRSQTQVIRKQTNALTGYKIWMLRFGLWTSLFLSTLESTIVSTSLVSITNALDGFTERDWLVTAYLLTYTGFLTISAKMADIFGRKTMFLCALGLYTIASVICGISRSMTELIIFRAVQGMGASGIYALTFMIAPVLVPSDKYNKAMVMVQTVTIVASTLGPILGGAINAKGNWRWVFLLNIPGGLVSFLIMAVYFPGAHEFHGLSWKTRFVRTFHWTNFKKIDVLGSFLLLGGTIMLIFALQEGGSRFPWKSPAIIIPLIMTVVLLVAFIGWEFWLDPDRKSRQKEAPQEPLFQPTQVQSRLLSAILATTFCIGFPFVAIIINIPQRAQAVNGYTPLMAGLTLLPMMLTSPIAACLSGYLTSGAELPPFYIIVGSAALQLMGVGLMNSLPVNTVSLGKQQYVFEVFMGLGFGLMVPTLMKFSKCCVVNKDRSTSGLTGALIQTRVIAGAISVAICSTILNNYLENQLPRAVGQTEARMVLKSYKNILKLDAEQQETVRIMFAQGYRKQYQFLTGLTGLGLVACLFIWERNPRKAVKKQEVMEAADGGAGV